MDETTVYLDVPGEAILEDTGAQTFSIQTTGHEKNKVAGMLGALGDRTRLSPPLIILRV